MAAVLLLVGRGLESPDVVRRLLDVEDTPSKPQYNMAPEVIHLHLHNCSYVFPWKSANPPVQWIHEYLKFCCLRRSHCCSMLASLTVSTSGGQHRAMLPREQQCSPSWIAI